MNPRRLLLILRSRYKIVVLVAIVTVAITMIVSANLPKRYSAETSVMVDVRSPDPVAAVLLPAMSFPANLSTQVEIISSNRVARKVVNLLKLDESPTAKQQWLNSTGGRGKLEDWLVGRIPRGLKVNPSRDSNIINIAYMGTDPVFVAAVANAYAQAYIEAAIELKVDPARQYARWFGDQAKVLRESVEKAQSRLSEFQRQRGIVVTEESLDFETAKLNELAARLTAVQAEIRDAQSKQRSGSGTLGSLPEVLQNPGVAGLRSSVNQLEAKLKEAAGNLGSKHPLYLRMEIELAELRNRLEEETRLVTGSISSTTAVGKTREAELMGAIQAQKNKLLQLKGGRDELAVLMRDVETAKRAYDAVTNRYTQTNLESQATQTNVSVLTPAIEPLEPSFPKPFESMLMIAILLGILLGGASGLAIEMFDHRVRSAEDLAEMLPIPVIGIIERIKSPSRLEFLSRRAALTVR